MKKLLLIFPLLLVGCADWAAYGVTEANYLRDSTSSYVHEVHDFRRWVREECRDMLQNEITQLQQNGQFAEARNVLIDSYPSLVTVDLIRDAQKIGDETVVEDLAINYPWSCGRKSDAILPTGVN